MPICASASKTINIFFICLTFVGDPYFRKISATNGIWCIIIHSSSESQIIWRINQAPFEPTQNS